MEKKPFETKNKRSAPKKQGIFSKFSSIMREKGSKGIDFDIISETECGVIGIGNCTDNDIVIPRYTDGYKVAEIGEGAFADCIWLTSVRIHGGIKRIRANAFCGCKKLEKIIVPHNVEKIEKSAFDDCLNLKSIVYKGTMEEWQSISGRDTVIENTILSKQCGKRTLKISTVTGNGISKGKTSKKAQITYDVYCMDGNVTVEIMYE